VPKNPVVSEKCLVPVNHLIHRLVAKVIHQGKDHRMNRRLLQQRPARREGQQDTGRQNKEEYCNKERHHRVKHGYTTITENTQQRTLVSGFKLDRRP